MSLKSLTHSGYDLEAKYFYELNQERIHELNEERNKMHAEHGGKDHWMICPKCGAKMEENEYHHVKVETCPSCEAVTLDKGQLKLLLDNVTHEESESHAEEVYKTFYNLFH